MYINQIIFEMNLGIHATVNPLGNQESLKNMKKKPTTLSIWQA